MPIYEFSCDSCGHEFEKIVSFSATDTPDCPACESDAVTRLLGKPAIHFKGSGWYITDSKKSNGKASTSNGETSDSSDKSTKTESTGTSESPVTTEAVTATKAESSETGKSKDAGDKTSAKPKS